MLRLPTLLTSQTEINFLQSKLVTFRSILVSKQRPPPTQPPPEPPPPAPPGTRAIHLKPSAAAHRYYHAPMLKQF